METLDHGEESDPDSDVDVKLQELAEEYERKAAEAKQDEGKIKDGDLDMRMGGKGGGPPAGMMPKVRKGSKASNTGPKGVKADYEEAKMIQAFKNLRAAMRAEREIKKKATGKTNFVAAVNKAEKGASTRQGGDEDEDEDFDEDDDEFFDKYKKQQIELIKNSLPTFGSFNRVSRTAFIQETEKEHDLVYIVVHLYRNHIPSCIRLNLILEDLAPQFHHVKFLRTRANDLVEGFSDIALPMLLVYRGGDVAHTIPQVTKHFPRGWEDKDVVEFLAKKGILNKNIYQPPKRGSKGRKLKQDY
eukprot:555444-Amorphochlora_amoeboformis.AAC.1